jgi:hypothetical protein
MDNYRRYFRIVVWLGILANWLFAVTVIVLDHRWIQTALGLDPNASSIWLYNYSFLLALLSCFYIPAARDPFAYRVNAWLLIFCRLIPATTFLLGVALGFMPGRFLVLAVGDGTFGMVELVLLWLMMRSTRAGQPASQGA